MSNCVFGDIHGYLDKLRSLIGSLNLTDVDKLIFLGDYIDRGPNSKHVVDYLLRLAKQHDCVFLMGNHEHMLLDFMAGCKTYGPAQWIRCGGDATLASYGLVGAQPGRLDLPREHAEFFAGLAVRDYCHLDPGYVFVHAGLNWDKPLEKNNWQDCLWNRSAFIDCRYHWPEGRVIFGHSQSETLKPIVQDNKIGIDTGCAAGGVLTALRLPEVRFHAAGV